MRRRGEAGCKDALDWARVSAAALLTGLCLPIVTSAPAYAQSVLPGATDASEEEIVVIGERRSALDIAETRARQTAGGVSVTAIDDVAQEGNLTLSSALSSSPGVVVQTFFGANDQPRLQIRGSGLQQNPVERGILLMQDGLPLNRADGAYAVGLVDPRQAAFAEIFRGYTANRLGATVMGGAVNFVLPSGSEIEGLDLRLEAGSFEHVYTALDAGLRRADWEGGVRLSHGEREGFRDYNSSERTSLGATFVYRWNSAISTRTSVGFVDNRFDVSGPLNRAALEADASQVFGGPLVVGGVAINPGPNVLRDRPQRDTQSAWAGSRTTAALAGGHVIDFTTSYVWSDDSFLFPVSAGERVTESDDVNVMLRYAFEGADEGLPLFELSSHFAAGRADRDYYLNAAGERGALFGEGDLEAATVSLHAEANLPLGHGIVFSPAVSYARADRSFDDQYGLATRPTLAFNPMNPSVRLPDGALATTDTSHDRSYDGLSFSVAASWRPGPRDLVYLGWSQNFEPPTHDDLIAAINGTPNSSPGRPTPGNPALSAPLFATPALREQRGDTIELGWRAQRDRFGVDALVYYSWLDGELLSLRDASGAPLGAVNADETRHFGVELGLDLTLSEALSARLAYVYQDFRFHDDPLRGDNYLAGAPRHVINVDLNYDLSDALRFGLSAHWRPEETPVDNMNTLYSDGFAAFDARVTYRPTAHWRLFAEAQNFTDETYAGSSLVVDQARPDQAVFIPADGRAFYVGFTIDY